MARPTPATDPVQLRFDEFELDEANAKLLRAGKPVAIAPTPFSLLCQLARQPGALLSKDALLDAVWGHQFVSESVLKTAVSDLRIVLGDNPREPRFIETVSRRGYRFIAVTRDVPPPMPQPAIESSPSFIGRADAMGRLQRAWGRACGGQRAVLWVAGEPGIGKTTLIEHFVTSLGNVVSARGQCVEHYGAGEPYLPVLEALADLCRNDPELPALLRSVAPTWLLQLPWLGSADEREALRRELAGVGPDRMLREMGELLDRYTEQRPLLLVTEDLHWSDRATIQLIDHVARRRGRARLMWLASFRVAEVVALEHPLNPLRRELRLHRLCEEVVLDSFSETEVADFVGRRSAPLARDEAFIRALHARTDGVPLFVSSVIDEVMERDGGASAAPARLADVAVPENLAAIIEHYIALLGAEQRALLAVAAVCGVAFRDETVALALGRDLASVALVFDELVRGHLWLVPQQRPEGPAAGGSAYAFRHALFRQVLYERTPPSARVQLHREVGAALEKERAAGVPVAAAELAMHFERGRQPMTALRYTAEAAEAALLHFSPGACLALAERASELLRLVPAGAERNTLEITLATLEGVSAFQLLGVGERARDAFERAYALLPATPEHPMRGRLLHGFGYLLCLRGDYAHAREVAARAEAFAAESNDPLLMLAACFVNAEVLHMQGRTQATRSWIEQGLAITAALDTAAHDLFTADPQVTLRGMLALELARCGELAKGRAELQQARSRSEALRQPMTRLVAAWHEALFAVRLRDAARVGALAEEMQRLVDEFSLAHGQAASQWFGGWAEARQGRPVEGTRRIREGSEHNLQLGMRAGASEVLGYAAEGLLLAGDLGAAQATLQQAMQVVNELVERVYLPQLLLLQAELARRQGQAEAGAQATRQAIEEAWSQQAPWLELVALLHLCEHHEPSDEERRCLAELMLRLPEAAETPEVQRAKLLAPAARARR